MNFSKKDLKIEYTRGTGPGGQNKNKVHSKVKITHISTGITVAIDGRDQGQNKKHAMRELEKRLVQLKENKKAEIKKSRRDKVIHDKTIIRTYNYDRGIVKDHRSKKTASIKDVLDKGKIDLLK